MKDLNKTAESICQDLKEYQLDLIHSQAEYIDARDNLSKHVSAGRRDNFIKSTNNIAEYYGEMIDDVDTMISTLINHQE